MFLKTRKKTNLVQKEPLWKRNRREREKKKILTLETLSVPNVGELGGHTQ